MSGTRRSLKLCVVAALIAVGCGSSSGGGTGGSGGSAGHGGATGAAGAKGTGGAGAGGAAGGAGTGGSAGSGANGGTTGAGGQAGAGGTAGSNGGSSGSAGHAGQGGHGGVAGQGGSAGAAGAGGAAGGGGGGAAGAAGGAAGGGASGAAGQAGTTGSAGVGGSASAGAGGHADLCTPFTPNSTAIVAVNATGSVDTTSFAGGTLVSGTYWLTGVTHYGSNYGGPTQEILVIDAAAATMEDAGAYGGGAVTVYSAWSLSNATPTLLAGASLCPGGISVSGWYYTVGSGTLTLNGMGSSDVKVFTKQ